MLLWLPLQVLTHQQLAIQSMISSVVPFNAVALRGFSGGSDSLGSARQGLQALDECAGVHRQGLQALDECARVHRQGLQALGECAGAQIV